MFSKNVLITGGSNGIGKEMAKIFYQKGYNLILTGRNLQNLDKAKQDIMSENSNGFIETISADLSTKNGADSIYQYTEKNRIQIDVLVNNAGVGVYGGLIQNDLEKIYSMIMLNDFSLVKLCNLYSKQMKDRKNGYILNIASLAAYQPVPYISTYAASKSFVLNFSEAFSLEMLEHGVNVTCVSPGHTDTNFFASAAIPDTNSFYSKKTRVQPNLVAQYAIKSMFAKKRSVVYGAKNKFLSFLNKLVPRSVAARIALRLVSKV